MHCYFDSSFYIEEVKIVSHNFFFGKKDNFILRIIIKLINFKSNSVTTNQRFKFR